MSKKFFLIGGGIIILALVIVLVIGFKKVTSMSTSSQPETLSTTSLDVGTNHYTAEVVATPAEQTQGLSDRKDLASSSVMLFAFQFSYSWQIWMKDMNFPLDIIWLNADKQVIYALPDITPATYPNVFTPSTPALYVVEANVGFIAANNIATGTQFVF